MAPDGTVTVKEVVVAAVTVAFVAPKYTALLVVVALNPVPVMVTDVPTAPFSGVKEEMFIYAPLFLNTLTPLNPPRHATSDLPSPSISPMAG